MYNIDKVCAYITYFLQEEITRHILKKANLEKAKEKLAENAECQKEPLDKYRKKSEQTLKLIKLKQKTPGISPATLKRLDEMLGEAEKHIKETDEKINSLYDELDERLEKIDAQIGEIDRKIDEINELIEDHGNDGQADEEIIRELEEEIRHIDMMDIYDDTGVYELL